jgi:uncharacterized membrane protein YgcG
LKRFRVRASTSFTAFTCGFITQIGYTIYHKSTYITNIDLITPTLVRQKKQQLEKLIQYADNTTTQIVVITIENTK